MAESIESFAETGQSNKGVQRQQWVDLGLHNYVKILIIAGLIYYLFRNEIASVVHEWLVDHSWSHGFLIPLFSLYLLDQRKHEILSLETKPSYLGLVLLIFGILLYFFNIISPSGYAYFRRLSIIAVIGSAALLLGGWRLIRHTWLPMAYLVFAVPVPRRYYVAATMPMRKLAASVAAALLNMVGEMEATARGVVIDVFYKGVEMEPPLNVAEACSGMRLLMAFVALGVAMAYLHYRPLWQRIILLASTVPIAIVCNIVRVTVTGFIYVLVHPKYTQGIYHDMLGMAMLPLAFGLYGFLGWFMSGLFIEEDTMVRKDIIYRKR